MVEKSSDLSVHGRADKAFPVSWDQFHRDCRALTWRLNEVGPFHAVVAITRGGLVPAAIVARELGLARHRYRLCGELRPRQAGRPESAEKYLRRHRKARRRHRQGFADRRRSRRHRKNRAAGARLDAGRAFRRRVRQAAGPAAGGYFYHRGVAGHMDPLSLGHRAVVPAADPGWRRRCSLPRPACGERSDRSEVRSG